MFASIAAFEFRYQLRNPVFWFVSLLFFLLTFGAVTSENIQIGGGGNVNVNSPGAISLTMLILTIFFMFVTTAFVANVIVRDDDSGFGMLVRGMVADGTIEVLHRERYVHRLSIAGKELHYVAVVARKQRHARISR